GGGLTPAAFQPKVASRAGRNRGSRLPRILPRRLLRRLLRVKCFATLYWLITFPTRTPILILPFQTASGAGEAHLLEILLCRFEEGFTLVDTAASPVVDFGRRP